MTNQRPTTITLKTGHVLTAVAGTLDWSTQPVAPDTAPIRTMGLRDLIGHIAHRPGAIEAYATSDKWGRFFVTYDIIDAIRAEYGRAFAWMQVPMEDSIVVLDELDDICCESRIWATGGGVQPLVTLYTDDKPWKTHGRPSKDEHERGLAAMTALIHRHNVRIGYAEPSVDAEIADIAQEMVDDHIVISAGVTPLFAFRGPRGLRDHEHGFADYVINLAA